MLSLKSALKGRVVEKTESKATSSWTALCEDIAKKYNVAQKRFRWLFFRVEEHKIRKAYETTSTIQDLIKHSLSMK